MSDVSRALTAAPEPPHPAPGEARPLTTAQDYLSAVIRRARVRMEPVDFQIDWADAPRRTKYYTGLEQMPLGDLTPGHEAPPSGPANGFSLPLLADMLRETYADSDRRLALHANSDVDELPRYGGATYSRGVASGGGRYPVSIYWVSGPSGSVTPGVHYYSTAHHGMQRLLTGDVSAQVAAALSAAGGPGGTDAADAGQTDQYLILGIKFWQNSFKYNSFCYHAVTMDIGTVTEAWRLWSEDHGLTLRPALWFDEPALGELLGLDPSAEGLFAVVPLPWEGRHDGESRQAATAATVRSRRSSVRVRAVDRERSRTVLEFEAVTEMENAAVAGCLDRPEAMTLRAAERIPGPAGLAVALPEPLPRQGSISTALRRRRSSFGRFSASPSMTAAELATLLAAGDRSARFVCDASDEDGLNLVTQFVFVNHVHGIAPGAYRYEPADHTLVEVAPGRFGSFLQQHYYLENYNLEQTGAVIVPCVRAAAVLEAVGDRGYRLVNAVVGAVTQGLYLAAADAGIGCGAALGFDNVAYMEQLRLTGSDTVPLIIVMAGHERPAQASFRYELH